MEKEERNRRPEEGKNTTPTIVLIVLFSIVLLLLYAGWNLMSDDSAQITEMQEVNTAKVDETVPNELAPEPIAEAAPTAKEPAPKVNEEKKSTLTTNYRGETALHTVKSGETFFRIATNFNTTAKVLQALNPDEDPNNIKIGITKLKVPVQAVHTVGPGDILRVVAGKYDVSIEALMGANNKTRNYAERGEKLLIPHKKKVE